MTTLTADSLTAREARRQQKLFQKKKARMASSWLAWEEFYKDLAVCPSYERTVNKIVARISQEVALAKNMGKYTIRWDEGRDRIMTLDLLQDLAERFGKSHATIYRDVAKVASHASWLSGIARRGDYGILTDVINELKKSSRSVDSSSVLQVVVISPAKPVIMTAAEINDHVRRANESFRKAEAEFLGDEPKIPKTSMFDFLGDIDRQVRFMDRTGKKRRKPRRNWRKEI